MPSHSNRSTQTLQLRQNFIISGSLTFVAMITRHQGTGMQEFSSFQSWLIFNLLIYRIYAYFHHFKYMPSNWRSMILFYQESPSLFLVEKKTWRLNILGIFGQAIGPQCRTVGLVCGGKACCRQLLTRKHRQLWVRLYASPCVKFVTFPLFFCWSTGIWHIMTQI